MKLLEKVYKRNDSGLLPSEVIEFTYDDMVTVRHALKFAAQEGDILAQRMYDQLTANNCNPKFALERFKDE